VTSAIKCAGHAVLKSLRTVSTGYECRALCKLLDIEPEEAEEKEEIAQEEKERQLRELSDSTGVHSSQAKIKVIGING
jgi:hypothetical protein